MTTDIPKIKQSSRFNLFSSIWIVPLIALVIALWLTLEYFSKLGPKIDIMFESNKGLKEGQSQIKYRDIVVGTIEKVALRSSGEGVRVTARMDKEVAPYLNDETKFWIVKPEVGVGGVSGLDTIISGTYINMKSQKKRMTKRSFIGLEESLKESKGGIRLHLNASNSYNVRKGTELFFKGLPAGSVEEVNISKNAKGVDILLFVDKTFVPYIHSDSKFWVQSALNIAYEHGKLDFSVAPLTNLIRGGIEFSSSGRDIDSTPPKDFVFRLYKNSTIASYKKIGKRGAKELKEYLLSFDESISKLNYDASVEYEGYDIGRVKDIRLYYNKETHIITSKVVISIDSSIFYDSNNSNYTGEDNLRDAVKEGLRASLEEQDPITRMQYIELSFRDDNSSKEIIYRGEYAIFPTYKEKKGNIMAEVNSIIEKIKKLPLDKLIDSMDRAINSFTETLDANRDVIRELIITTDKMLESINLLVASKEFKNIPSEINQTLKTLQKSLKSFDTILKGNGDNSLLTSQLSQTLKEVSETSRDTQRLLKKLEQKPNSLLFGD
jgi:paraquat-inducible protein B